MIIVFTVRSQCGAMTAGVLVNSVKKGGVSKNHTPDCLIFRQSASAGASSLGGFAF